MKVTCYLSDGGTLDFENFDAESALDLRAAVDDEQKFLVFDMDGATVLVNRDHVVRIDMET